MEGERSQEKPHTLSHSHTPFSSHTRSHTRTPGCALTQPPSAALEIIPLSTRGLSCTGGAELLPCTSVSSECRGCHRVVCVSVRACVRACSSRRSLRSLRGRRSPRGPGGSPGSPPPPEAGAPPSCPAQGEARGCPALGASPVDVASVAWLGHLQPCGPGQLEQMVSSLSGGDVK